MTGVQTCALPIFRHITLQEKRTITMEKTVATTTKLLQKGVIATIKKLL